MLVFKREKRKIELGTLNHWLTCRVIDCAVETDSCESEIELMVKVNALEVIVPLRLKSKVWLPSGPVLPLAFGIIVDPEAVPAKLKVTGELPTA